MHKDSFAEISGEAVILASYLKACGLKQARTNLIHRTQFFGRGVLLARLILHLKTGTQSQSARPI